MKDDERELWRQKRQYSDEDMALAQTILEEIRRGTDALKALRSNPLPGGRGFLAKHALVAAYREKVSLGEWEDDPVLLAKIRMKPIRTLSGVTTITVLTKPHPCPGECIFCPSEEGLPQSYLSDEPGARRGVEHAFDPFTQVSSRLKALHEVGHPTDKIELLILGGSWTAYPASYREWYIRRCFEALNQENPNDDTGEVSLADVQKTNSQARHRNVGLVVETRPDLITIENLVEMRRQGVTKMQLGIQSMDDRILQLNKRGHSAEEAEEAICLVRAAGYKVVVHWMPNLLGATPQSDRKDFARLWREGGVNPDEMKIYPCQLLRNAELYQYWERGEYRPYEEQELIDLLADIKPTVPRFCRINRVIRDIPSNHVVEGNRNTSLRQDVAQEMKKRGSTCQCIRCREIRKGKIDDRNLVLDDQVYKAGWAEEHFLSYNTQDDHILGFLRLSLPSANHFFPVEELQDAAIIREVHVYGQSVELGGEGSGSVQHRGLGSSLIEKAAEIALSKGYRKLTVISAVGTREYYAARGFTLTDLYMVRDLRTEEN
ncbi:MAG: tRNA uridine(34) 5-carboxymethylaminomethyl modification radical SAM/GNAT enzyme Elp3 [Chloroflexi bacterium]|nr:tRNA uridine(34) 5-carboxymethylaminomethyl modification radical SAM/GNAT enzyme Elp3 [Chloroflexota bacterium]